MDCERDRRSAAVRGELVIEGPRKVRVTRLSGEELNEQTSTQNFYWTGRCIWDVDSEHLLKIGSVLSQKIEYKGIECLTDVPSRELIQEYDNYEIKEDKKIQKPVENSPDSFIEKSVHYSRIRNMVMCLLVIHLGRRKFIEKAQQRHFSPLGLYCVYIHSGYRISDRCLRILYSVYRTTDSQAKKQNKLLRETEVCMCKVHNKSKKGIHHLASQHHPGVKVMGTAREMSVYHEERANMTSEYPNMFWSQWSEDICETVPLGWLNKDMFEEHYSFVCKRENCSTSEPLFVYHHPLTSTVETTVETTVTTSGTTIPTSGTNESQNGHVCLLQSEGMTTSGQQFGSITDDARTHLHSLMNKTCYDVHLDKKVTCVHFLKHCPQTESEMEKYGSELDNITSKYPSENCSTSEPLFVYHYPLTSTVETTVETAVTTSGKTIPASGTTIPASGTTIPNPGTTITTSGTTESQ
ncbi:hypothetical protein GQR58_024955 [Nymphon striatum]|nr:hypothetical protein GQR58_024955 [Nymphon striatum]